MNAFTSVRPKARPGKSAGIKRPSMQHKRYPGFVIGSGSIIAGYPTAAISYGDPATYGIDVGFSF